VSVNQYIYVSILIITSYPGLMCDVESYIYMPLLEELGYMPKHKYSYGPELRKHAENIADRYNLKDKTMFQAKMIDTTWDDKGGEWVSTIESSRKGQEGKKITARSRYVLIAGGTVNWPKLPRLQGFNDFKGQSFHTSRWDYACTGGNEEKPDMVNLKNKVVGIIGTGATAIQAVPELAKWAKHVYVFQRTPSSVDTRGQQETDIHWWNEVKDRKGWQRERRTNFSSFVSNTDIQPTINLVGDGWTTFLSYAGVIGNEVGPKTPAEAEAYVTAMTALDLVRQEKIRSRVDTIVEDKETAERLKPWYPGWCKRPCFHDDYLQSFNKPNVTLVDTDGRGLDRMTENGPYFEGKEYPLDVLVLSTGYEIPIGATPAEKLGMKVTGQNGTTFNSKWKDGVKTLHSIQTNGLPNFFLLGLSQAGATPNQVAMVDELAQHIAFIIKEATQKHATRCLVIQPTTDAEEAWTEKIVNGAHVFATMGTCPPSYFNGEGDLFELAADGPDVQKKLATGAFWSKGLNHFSGELATWRSSRPLSDFDIRVIQSVSKL
jgi:cation diffusion facilitator CzcD-associated flavoprotein CzcO